MPASLPNTPLCWFRRPSIRANQPLKVSFRLGETTYSWKSNTDITLEQGKYYTLSLNIKKTGVVVEGTIKGWIPAEGNNEYVAN